MTEQREARSGRRLAAVGAAVAQIVDQYGRIDVLDTNAGPLDPDDHGLEANAVATWHAAYSSRLLPVVLTGSTWSP